MTLSQTYISRKQLLVDNLVAKGVTGYTANDGLTTLINAVLEIQGGGVRTLTLTSDKDLLSYADSESATLTATLLEDGVGVSGATVEFFNGSTSMGTAQTDSTGVATKTYTSTGAGDVSLSAEADNGMLVSETCDVQDCWKYDSNTYSSNKVYNLQLPSQYSLEFDMLKKGTSGGSAGGMMLGTDSNYFMVGCGSSASYQVARWGTNLSYVNLFSLTHNTWKTIRLEVDGSTVDIKADGNTYTVTGISSDITSLLYQINCNNTNINIKNLKIKPL